MLARHGGAADGAGTRTPGGVNPRTLDLLERGWLARDGDGRLWITEAGEEARLDLKRHAPAIIGRIHEGVAEADYVTTPKVLRQMIRNTGGTLPA